MFVLGAPRVIPVAVLICLKCANLNTKVLEGLDITFTQEEKRIITPEQAQRQSLVVPG